MVAFFLLGYRSEEERQECICTVTLLPVNKPRNSVIDSVTTTLYNTEELASHLQQGHVTMLDQRMRLDVEQLRNSRSFSDTRTARFARLSSKKSVQE